MTPYLPPPSVSLTPPASYRFFHLPAVAQAGVDPMCRLHCSVSSKQAGGHACGRGDGRAGGRASRQTGGQVVRQVSRQASKQAGVHARRQADRQEGTIVHDTVLAG